MYKVLLFWIEFVLPIPNVSPALCVPSILYVFLIFFWCPSELDVSCVRASTTNSFHGIRVQGLRRVLCSRQAFQHRQAFESLDKTEKKMDRGMGNSLWQKSSARETIHLGHIRCTSTCSNTSTRVMWKEWMMQHRSRHTETFQLGSKQQIESCMSDHMFNYIRDAKSLRDAWGT